MNNSRKVLLMVGLSFLLLFCPLKSLFAQEGTEFWFVAPEIVAWYNTVENPWDGPVRMVFSSNKSTDTEVTLSIPANPSFKPLHVTVPPKGTAFIDLTQWKGRFNGDPSSISYNDPTVGDIENRPANQVLKKGIYIQASQEIFAYYEMDCAAEVTEAPEIFTLKSKNALGTDFYVAGQNTMANNEYKSPICFQRMDVVATEDNTVVTYDIVTVDKTNLVQGHNQSHFTVNLNKGETYGIIANSIAVGSHFTGSHVTSNKPIAMTVTDDKVIMGFCVEVHGDQNVPVTSLGSYYIAVKSEDYDESQYVKGVYVTGVANNTKISVSGGSPSTYTLNAGETKMFTFTSHAMYLTSGDGKPFYAYQVSGRYGESGAAVLSPVKDKGYQRIPYLRAQLSSPPSNISFLDITLAVKAGNENNFKLNGSLTSLITESDFKPVDGTDGKWVSGVVRIPLEDVAQSTKMAIENTTSPFMMGVNEGDGAGLSYCFFGDFNHYVDFDKYVACEGDEVEITIQSDDEYTVYWYLDAVTSQSDYEGKTRTVVKNGDEIQYFYIEVARYMQRSERIQVPVYMSNMCGDTADMACAGVVLAQQDFGGNDATDQGISSQDVISGQSDLSFSAESLTAGTYSFRKHCNQESWAFSKTDDHTYSDNADQGYMMVVCSDKKDDVLYKFDVMDLCDKADLDFVVWVSNLEENRPKFFLRLIDLDHPSKPLTSTDVLTIPKDKSQIWRQYSLNFRLPQNTHNVRLEIVDKSPKNARWAIDDISVSYCGGEARMLSTDTTICPHRQLILQSEFIPDSAKKNVPFVYQWQYSPTGEADSWVVKQESSNPDYEITATSTAHTGYYKVHIGEAQLLDGSCSFYTDSIYVNVLEDCCPKTDTVQYEEDVCHGRDFHNVDFDISGMEISEPGEYDFDRKYYDDDGCLTKIAFLHLNAKPTPNASIRYNEDFCPSFITTLECLTDDAGDDILWSTGDNGRTLTVTESGVYSVVVSNGSCEASAQILIPECEVEVYIPNAITASNEDNLNRYFGISCANMSKIEQFEVNIFNRWGQLIFKSTDPNFKWEPQCDEKGIYDISPNNVYVYRMTYTVAGSKQKKLKGSIVVL